MNIKRILDEVDCEVYGFFSLNLKRKIKNFIDIWKDDIRKLGGDINNLEDYVPEKYSYIVKEEVILRKIRKIKNMDNKDEEKYFLCLVLGFYLVFLKEIHIFAFYELGEKKNCFWWEDMEKNYFDKMEPILEVMKSREKEIYNFDKSDLNYLKFLLLRIINSILN